MKVASLKDYQKNPAKITEIDISGFSVDELRGLAVDLSSLKDLPSLKLTGIPKDIGENAETIKELLDLVTWNLGEKDQKELRETLGVKWWDFTDFDIYDEERHPPKEGWLLQLNLGLELNDKDNTGNTVAHYAAAFGYEEVLELIIEQDPERLSQKNDFSDTPAHYAAMFGHTKAFELILEKTPEMLEISNDDGDFPAHLAAYNGNKVFLRLMIEKKPELLELRNRLGNTPVMLVAKKGNQENFELILEKQPKLLEQKNDDGVTPAILVIQNGNGAILKIIIDKKADLLEQQDENGLNCAHWAARNGQKEFLELIIAKKPDLLTQRDNKGNTLAHLAVRNGHTELFKRLIEQHPEILGQKNKKGETVAHCAAKVGLTDIFAWLIAQHSDLLDQKNDDGDTPATLAAERGKIEVLELIIREKPELLQHRNKDGNTPAILVAKGGIAEVLQLMIEANPKVLDQKGQCGFTPIMWLEVMGWDNKMLQSVLENFPEKVITEIDVSDFKVEDLAVIATPLDRMGKLASFTLKGLPKDIEESEKGLTSINLLLGAINWELTKDEQQKVRDKLKIDMLDLSKIKYDNVTTYPDSKKWIMNANLGLDLKETITDSEGKAWTPAIIAAKTRYRKTLAIMMKKVPSVVEARDHNGMTLAHHVARASDNKLLQFIFQNMSKDQITTEVVRLARAKNVDEKTISNFMRALVLEGHFDLIKKMFSENPEQASSNAYAKITMLIDIARSQHNSEIEEIKNIINFILPFCGMPTVMEDVEIKDMEQFDEFVVRIEDNKKESPGTFDFVHQKLTAGRIKTMKEVPFAEEFPDSATSSWEERLVLKAKKSLEEVQTDYKDSISSVEEVEENIRKFILLNLLDNAKLRQVSAKAEEEKQRYKEIVEYLTEDNIDKLVKLDESELNRGRAFFNEPYNFYHAAWRSYDPGAPVSGEDPNLFTPSHSTEMIFSTEEAIEGGINEHDAANIIRKYSAALYLAMHDETGIGKKIREDNPDISEEEVKRQTSSTCKDLKTFFFNSLMEIRDAHGTDQPSCFPGTLTRLAQILNMHPKYRSISRQDIILTEAREAIVKIFNEEIKSIKEQYPDELVKQKQEITKLHWAITMLSSQNMYDILLDKELVFSVLDVHHLKFENKGQKEAWEKWRDNLPMHYKEELLVIRQRLYQKLIETNYLLDKINEKMNFYNEPVLRSVEEAYMKLQALDPNNDETSVAKSLQEALYNAIDYKPTEHKGKKENPFSQTILTHFVSQQKRAPKPMQDVIFKRSLVSQINHIRYDFLEKLQQQGKEEEITEKLEPLIDEISAELNGLKTTENLEEFIKDKLPADLKTNNKVISIFYRTELLKRFALEEQIELDSDLTGFSDGIIEKAKGQGLVFIDELVSEIRKLGKEGESFKIS